jgi:hypothetical protein
MAKEGYSTPAANALAQAEGTAIDAKGPGTGSSGLTGAQNKAQIATAVADADCTQAADLAGVYFAVQGSYEQQIVDANTQALAAAVREYKTSYARELSELPTLLRTASATLELPGRAGGPEVARGPSPARS